MAAAGPLAAALPQVEVVAFTGPGAWLAGYATPVLAVPLGGQLTLLNYDLMRHDVVAYETFGPDGQPWCAGGLEGFCPLFWSPLAPGLGGQVQVLGLGNLEPLVAYPYYCTIHQGMRGTLVALPAT